MDFSKTIFLPRDRLQDWIELMWASGYDVIGPTVRQGAVVLDRVHHADELPRGWKDDQEPARYRLEQDDSKRCFQFNVGPSSWKQFLFPAESTISGARLDDDGWHFSEPQEAPPRYAFLGVRACDLAAIEVQDRVFIGDHYIDPYYEQAREQALVIVVECAKTASTCFCHCMGTGPRCRRGFDLAMTELDDGFLVASGSDRGDQWFETLRETLRAEPSSPDQRRQAETQMASTEASLGRQFETEGVPELLMKHLDHPSWDQVAERCLSCTNCTMVCPTCFCSTVEEVGDLDQTEVDRVRRWDSCFNPELSYTCGGTARPDRRSRYRQWLTHKLATWHDQFDTSGCVGCGRCITWCPVGIDLTEEVDRIRDSVEPTK